MTTLATMFAFHPGHGATDPVSWRHYLTEPMHAGVLALAVLAVAAAVVLLRRTSKA